MSYVLDLNELKEFKIDVNKFPKKAKEQVKKGMTVSTGAVKTKARELVPVDTGRLRQSIVSDVKGTGFDVVGVVSPKEKYGVYVELGTKPHFPPVGALSKWAKKRGLNPYLIARSISKKGTKPHPFMAPALEKSKEKVIKIIKEAIDYAINTTILRKV